MGLFTAKMRITVGLTCLAASVLLVAVFIGMIPDRGGAVLDGRRKLCEAIAVNSSILVSTKDIARLRAVLKAVVERDEDILSAGIRRPSGDLEIEIGPHQAHWKGIATDRSFDEQMQVPLRAGKTKWGTVELRFRPLGRAGWLGTLASPIVLLVTFCAAGSFVVFMIYLGKMLQHLDPSQAVPRRVRSALDTLAEGLLVIDKDERIVLANQALGTWVGRDPSRLLGRKSSELPWVSANGDSLSDYPWSRAVREGSQLAGFEMGIKKGKHGEVRSLMVNATPVLGQNGDYRGVLVSLDDVTQLETTRKELQVSKVAAEDANRAKSDFLARMSHEIRTPMNAILGYTDVLRQGYDETDGDRQDYLDTIHVSGEHLLALINDILDLSKIEAGHLELEVQPVAPYPLLAHVVSVFQARADEKGIQLDFQCDGPIPATIQTDPVRLRQAIMNLVGNAIKFTERGGVRLVSRLTSDNGKPVLAIDVSDTGIGISAAAIESIFNPFSQADTSITRRFGGTGLGLAISLQLAEAMGGGISVTSNPGQGSTFTVTIDPGSLSGISLLSAEDAKTHSEKSAAKPRAVRTLPPGNVLVADDGEANRKLLQLVLGRAGMTVVAVENGQEAVEAARSQEFDVILMDMQMPVMDGYTATSTLRKDGYTIPIIALTAHVMQSDQVTCRNSGCSGFVSKPIDMDTLFAVITEQMGVPYAPTESSTEVDDDQRDPTATLPASSGAGAVAAVPSDGAVEGATPVNTAAVDVEPVDAAPVNGAPANMVPTHAPLDTAPTDASDRRRSTAAPCLNSEPTDAQPAQLPGLEIEEVVAEVLATMQASLKKEDFPRLANLASSLSEAAAVFSLPEYVVGTTQLELAARHQLGDDCRAILEQLLGCRSLNEATAEAESSMVASAPAEVPRTELPSGVAPDRPVAQPAEAPALSPLVSTLPMDDPEFREVVVAYVETLKAHMDAMLDCWEQRDYVALGEQAHWLKGSAGTAGFGDFTPVAQELVAAVREQDTGAISSLIIEIGKLTERVTVDPAEATEGMPKASETRVISPLDFPPAEVSLDSEDELPSSGPIHSTLPTEDPEFREIVVEFIEKVRVKMEVMQSAFDAGQWAELAHYAHWLKGSGGTAGFNEFTVPARELETVSKSHDVEGTTQALAVLREICSRIEVPEILQSSS